MSGDNEKETSISTSLKTTNHDLSDYGFSSYKQKNSTHRRSASVPLNSQDDSDYASVSQPVKNDPQLNTQSSLSVNSQNSTKIETNNGDRFGGLHSDNNDEDSRDYDSNVEENDIDENVNQHDPYRPNSKDLLRTPLQLKFYYFFERPSSKWAKSFEAFSTLCTISTIVIICVFSWPTIHQREAYIYNYWIPVDIVSLITFTIEYLGRFYASINKLKFFFKPMNLIDLISIVPYYLQLISPKESILKFIRVLRLFRIIRLFNVAKYTAGFNITARVLQRSAYQIVMVFVYVLIIVLASSALMFYLERGSFNPNTLTWYRIGKDGSLEVSPFQSIIHSFWWSVVTLTTTGYGDAVPVTGPGKLVAALTMTCGILVIALPTSIIGSNFNNEWTLHRSLRFQQSRESVPEYASKGKRISGLQKQNKTMLEALAEIQGKLADINPPRYYKKYKKLEIKHLEALRKITELENKLAKWKRIARNLDIFHSNGSFLRKADVDSDSGDIIDNSFERGSAKTSGWKFRNIPIRNFGSLPQRSESDAEAHYKNKHKYLSPFKTLARLGKSPKSGKVPDFTKELISSPTELRPSSTLIIDSRNDNNANSANDPFSRYIPRSASGVELRYMTASEHTGNTGNTKNKGIDKDNADKNRDEDLSSDRDHDDIIEKNDLTQNTATEEIVIVVDKVND